MDISLSGIFGHRGFSGVGQENQFWNALAGAERNAGLGNKVLQASNNGGILYRSARQAGEFIYSGTDNIVRQQNGVYNHEGVAFKNLDRFRWFQADDGFNGLAVRMSNITGGMVDISGAAANTILKAFGGDKNDHIKGGARGDSIQGGKGNDILEGMAGDDAIWGDNGDDVLDGGAGKDRLEGGAGRDTFIINSGDGDEVVDFKRGEDKLIVDGQEVNLDALPDGYSINGNQLKKGDTVLLTFR